MLRHIKRLIQGDQKRVPAQDLSQFALDSNRLQVVNVFRESSGNVGDTESAVSHFFFTNAQRGDIGGAEKIPLEAHTPVVVGGGGLLQKNLHANLQSLHNRSRRVAVWGAGSDDPISEPLAFPEFLKDIKLVGIRDFNRGYDWVPCTSCMHSIFDTPAPPQHDIILYDHKRTPIPIEGLPQFANDGATFDDVIKFLCSGETIITSSYYGMYWATLLGRRVVLYKPDSTKFLSLKYRVGVCDLSNWLEKAQRSRVYPEALSECRAANLQFADKVQNFFNASLI